jgi:hypothetical protein
VKIYFFEYLSCDYYNRGIYSAFRELFLKIRKKWTCQESERTSMDISIEVGRGLLEGVLCLAFGSSEVDILSRKMKRQNF